MSSVLTSQIPASARVTPSEPPRTPRTAWREAGWPRALICMVLAGAFGFGLVVALRAISGLEIFQTEATGYPHIIVPAITAPIGFLFGIGCFDYWLRWAAGATARMTLIWRRCLRPWRRRTLERRS